MFSYSVKMNTFVVLTLCFTAAFAAPPNLRLGPAGSIWDFHSSMLDDFEANLRRMRDEFDQLEKSLESRFKFPDVEQTGVQILENGTSIFHLDPSKVKNESFSDTKIVDGKVVRTEEKVIANGNSVVHFKKVEITPKDDIPSPANDQEKKTFRTPASTAAPSKNDVDSEHEGNEETADRARDVEEIESVSASAGSSFSSGSQSREPQKQIYLV